MLNVVRYVTISTLFILIFAVFMIFNPGVYTPVDDDESLKVVISRNNESTEQTNPSKQSLMLSIIASSDSDPTLENCRFTLNTLNLEYSVYYGFGDFFSRYNGKPHTVIVTTNNITGSDAENLLEYLENGGNVIFTVMPSARSFSSASLLELFGILEIESNYTIKRADIYEGILIGGMYSAEDVTFSCYRVTLDGKCRVYASGMNPDRDIDSIFIAREDKNPIIWRKHFGSGMLFAVNAPFISQTSGLGMLSGIIAMTENTLMYPVIAARSIILDAFPYIADNSQIVSDRSVMSFMRDIMLPDLISMSTQLDITYTCYTNGYFGKTYDSMETYTFFETQIKKAMSGETGYSVNPDAVIYNSDIEILAANNKLSEIRSYIMDKAQLENNDLELNEEHTSAVLRDGGLDSIKWISDNAVSIPVITKNVGGDDDVLEYLSVLTLLGVVIHSIDIAMPIEQLDNSWNTYAIDIASYITFLNDKSGFIESMTISQTAEAVKNYLNTVYSIEYSDSGINVTMEGNTGEVSLFLRTVSEIEAAVNCTIEETADNVYVVRSAESHFEVKLRQEG